MFEHIVVMPKLSCTLLSLADEANNNNPSDFMTYSWRVVDREHLRTYKNSFSPKKKSLQAGVLCSLNVKIPSSFDAGASKLNSLGAARLAVTSCTSSSSSVVFKGSLEQQLPAFSHNVQDANWLLNIKAFIWRLFQLELFKMDERDFSLEILAVQLHCKAMVHFNIPLIFCDHNLLCHQKSTLKSGAFLFLILVGCPLYSLLSENGTLRHLLAASSIFTVITKPYKLLSTTLTFKYDVFVLSHTNFYVAVINSANNNKRHIHFACKLQLTNWKLSVHMWRHSYLWIPTSKVNGAQFFRELLLLLLLRLVGVKAFMPASTSAT